MQQSKFKKERIRKNTKEQDVERAQLLSFKSAISESRWALHLDDATLIKLMLKVGEYISLEGCRRDFDAAITDLYIRGIKNKRITAQEAHILREGIDTLDIDVAPKLVEPRLQILRDKIENLILNQKSKK